MGYPGWVRWGNGSQEKRLARLSNYCNLHVFHGWTLGQRTKCQIFESASSQVPTPAQKGQPCWPMSRTRSDWINIYRFLAPAQLKHTPICRAWSFFSLRELFRKNSSQMVCSGLHDKFQNLGLRHTCDLTSYDSVCSLNSKQDKFWPFLGGVQVEIWFQSFKPAILLVASLS